MLFPRSIDSRLNTFGCDATRNVNKLVEFQAQKKNSKIIEGEKKKVDWAKTLLLIKNPQFSSNQAEILAT